MVTVQYGDGVLNFIGDQDEVREINEAVASYCIHHDLQYEAKYTEDMKSWLAIYIWRSRHKFLNEMASIGETTLVSKVQTKSFKLFNYMFHISIFKEESYKNREKRLEKDMQDLAIAIVKDLRKIPLLENMRESLSQKFNLSINHPDWHPDWPDHPPH